jgi:hypothetical protein
MPNGGPTPDCFHCKFFQGQPSLDTSYCTHHQIKLAVAIYAFCSRYIDTEPDEYWDWLDQMLDSRASLDADMMYLWLGGDEINFFHVPLAPIVEYATCTRRPSWKQL